MPKNDVTFEEVMQDNAKDYGLELPEVPLTPEERKIAAISMAYQATFVRLVLEGIIPFGEELHMQVHFQEYANRLFRGDAVTLEAVNQTLKVDSVAGKLYAKSAENALDHGETTAANVRGKMEEAYQQQQKMVARVSDEDQQTNKEENDLSPTRTLN